MAEAAVVVLGSLTVWLLAGGGRHSRHRLSGLFPPPPGRSRGNGWIWAPFLLAPVLFAALGAGAAATAAVAGLLLWWRSRRAAGGGTQRPRIGELPIVIGLLSAGVRAGGTVPAVLAAVARASNSPLGVALSGVAERLRLGADPVRAWDVPGLPEQLSAVGRDLGRAADTGAPVAELLERHAEDIRRDIRTRATSRVQRLSVLVVAPLGLCFLPAFILIGVVPLAAGLLTDLVLP